jgi:large subunit ribosomal protein L29
MKNSEIKALSTGELIDKITTSEKTLQALKFGNAISPIENPMQIRDVRRLAAKLKTELHSRTINDIVGKVNAGDLTKLNAKAFFSENSFDSQITLAKVNKIIDSAS